MSEENITSELPSEPQEPQEEAPEEAPEAPETPQEPPETPPETPLPPTKTRAPRKKKATLVETPPQPQPPPRLVADANFWSELLQTRREMDRVATHTRFANLVKM
jgi:hypothetical protein